MAEPPQIQRVPLDQIECDPVNAPLRDDNFMRLMQEALEGKIPVYYSAIPLALLASFDPAFDPCGWEGGVIAVRHIRQEIQNGRPPVLIAYPSENGYCVSDDDEALAAFRSFKFEFAKCWVLGYPSLPGPIEIEGPVPVTELRRIFGIG